MSALPLVLCATVLCVVLGIVVYFHLAPVPFEERYVDPTGIMDASDHRPLVFINRLFGRNIAFPYFNSIPYLASERATSDGTSGSCRIVYRPPAINESYAIVQENFMFYNLRYTCIPIRFSGWRIVPGADSFQVRLLLETDADVDGVATLMRLNPLYLEIDVGSSRSSTACCINDRNLSLTSDRDGDQSMDITLQHVKGPQDSLFDYSKVNDTYVGLDVILGSRASHSNTLNVRAFFLDSVVDSFQSVGRTIGLTYDRSAGRSLVFEKSYAQYLKSNVPLYEFSNNLAIWWRNFVSPVFTFSVELCLDASMAEALNGRSVVVNKVYMDNDLGLYTDGKGVVDNTGRYTRSASSAAALARLLRPGSVHLDNVYAMVVHGLADKEHFELSVMTGSYTNMGINNEDGSNVRVTLPYLALGTSNRMTVQLTIAPTEKIIYASWVEPEPKFAYSKTNNADSAVHNNLHRLFVEKPRDAADTLENIVMDYDVTYVSNVNFARMGYQNFMRSA